MKNIRETIKIEKNSETPLYTDKVELSIEPSITDKFSFYQVIDLINDSKINYEKQSFFQNVTPKLLGHESIRATSLLRRGEIPVEPDVRMLLMIDNDKKEKIWEIEDELNSNGKIVKFVPVSYKKLQDYCEHKLAQLLLNGMVYINDDFYQFTNQGWNLLEFNHKYNLKDEKDAVLIFNQFTFTNEENFGLVLKNEIVTYTIYNEEYDKKDKELKKYIFKNNTMIPLKNGDNANKIYIKQGLANKKQTTDYIRLKVSQKPSNAEKHSKVNKKGKIIEKFNEVYNGLATLNNKPIYHANYITHKENVANSNKGVETFLLEKMPVIYIDYDQESINCKKAIGLIQEKDIIEQTQKNSEEEKTKEDKDIKIKIQDGLLDLGYQLNNIIIEQGISKTRNDIPILKIIEDKKYYEKKGQGDIYQEVDKLNVQHIICSDMDKAKVRNALISLYIQLSVKDNNIDVFDEMNYFEGITFFIPHYIVSENKDKNKESKNSYELNRIDFLEVKNQQINIYRTSVAKLYFSNNMSLLEALSKNENNIKEKDFIKFTWGFIKNEEIFLSIPTRIGTIVNEKEFLDKKTKMLYQKIKQNLYEKGTEEYKNLKFPEFRSEGLRNTILKSIVDSGYFTINNQYYYYSLTKGNGMKASQARRPLIHTFKNSSFDEELLINLLISMSQPFNRNGDLSIVPYPIKVLRTIESITL